MKNKLLLIIVLLFIINILFIFPKIQINEYEINANKYVKEDLLYDEQKVEQKFSPLKDADGMYIVIATYMKVFNKGNLLIKIENLDNNEIIYKKNKSLRTLDDSVPLYLKFKIKKNNNYKITLETKNVSIKKPIVYYSTDLVNQKIKYNDSYKDYELYINYFEYKKSYINVWYGLLIDTLAYMLYSLLWKEKENVK